LSLEAGEITLLCMSESGSAICGRSHTPDRWWVTALVAAVLTAIVIAMLRYWPTATFTWMVGGAVAAFVVVMHHNPQHWLKRRSATCLGIAGASAAVPAITGALSLPQGWIEISTDASPWVAGLFGVLSFCFALLDRAREFARNPVAPSTQPMVIEESESMVKAHNRAPVSIATAERPRDVVQTGNQSTVTIQNSTFDQMELIRLAMSASEEKGAFLVRATFYEEENRRLRADMAAIRRDTPQTKSESSERYRNTLKNADDAFQHGRIIEAKNCLEELLRDFPTDTRVINRLGNIHYLQGRIAEAEACYRRVEQIVERDSGQS
jgi:hypothetical protein